MNEQDTLNSTLFATPPKSLEHKFKKKSSPCF